MYFTENVSSTCILLATDWADLEVECPTAHNLTDDKLAHQAVAHEVQRKEDATQDVPHLNLQ